MKKSNTAQIIIATFFIGLSLSLMITTIISVFIFDKVDEKTNTKIDLILQSIPIYTGIIAFFTNIAITAYKEIDENKRYWFRTYVLNDSLKVYLQFIDSYKNIINEFIRKKQEILDNLKDKYTNDINDIDEIYKRADFANLNESNLIETTKKQMDNIRLIAEENFLFTYDSHFFTKVTDIIKKYDNYITKLITEEYQSLDCNNNYELYMAPDRLKSELLKLFYMQSMK